MANQPLVSTIMIFLNGREFMAEAIESVLTQEYTNWELLLVDDGSTDGSSELALQYAASYPDKIFYLEHPEHANRGMSASPNLGLRHARGEFIALLDADDVFLPHKLASQVAALSAQPEAGMLYGNTCFWYSWTGRPEDVHRDIKPALFSGHHPGLSLDSLIHPPALLVGYLDGSAALPAVCGLLARREAVEKVGGFEDAFRGMYEDQVFIFKMALSTSIYVADGWGELYRQHPRSTWSVSKSTGSAYAARLAFIDWLEGYLHQRGVEDPQVWQALRRNIWGYRRLVNSGLPPRLLHLAMLGRKWLLRLEKALLPASLRRKIWQRGGPVGPTLPPTGDLPIHR